MTKAQKTVLIIITVVVIGLLAYVAINQKGLIEPGEGGPQQEEEVLSPGGPVGTPEIEGGSPVSDDGKVLTNEGEVTNNAAEPGSQDAPQQTSPISEESVPSSAIKIKISSTGFEPNEFTVRSGEVVTVSITSVGTETHIFKFTDPSMSGVAVGVGPGETRAITFNAPENKGTYEFFCDVPGHAARGETGVMTVR